jgi:hypothetical protein
MVSVRSLKVMVVGGLVAGIGVVLPATPVGAVSPYPPQAVSSGHRPYDDLPQLPRHSTGTVDATGVMMHRVNGTLVDHPVGQAEYGLQLLNSYRLTHDSWYLTMAERQAQRIVDRKAVSRGAWWFPYPFTFALGSGIHHTMAPPWYSAMAEGQALSLFVRLADATGDSDWDTAADDTFEALTLSYSATEPWATWHDDHGRIWLEEYPGATADTSARVLNGHMFAAFGVWDYWRARQSSTAASLFSAALQTVQAYVLTRFRNPGWASSYSLRGLAPTEKYHRIHIHQLLEMHALTGEAVFAQDAEVLQQDFPAPAQPTVIRFAATSHTGVRFDGTATGRVVARRTVRLTGASSAPIDLRRRIHGQPGYWYHVTAGALNGWWVQEAPSVRATPGPVSVIEYLAPRTVRMATGAYSAYTATRSRTLVLGHASTAPVRAYGWINGRVSVQIAAGPLSGYWLPLASRTSLG